MPEQKLSVDELEFAVYQKDEKTALKTLIALLCQIEDDERLNDPSALFGEQSLVVMHATRICSAFMALICRRNMHLSYDNYVALSIHKSTITSLFSISGFAGTQVGLEHTKKLFENQSKKDASNLHKRLLFTRLEDVDEAFIHELEAMDKNVAIVAILALLTTRVVMNEAAYVGREQLLSLGPLMSSGAKLPDPFLSQFATAWMLCSYAQREDKHVFKFHMNQLMKNRLEDGKVVVPVVNRVDVNKERPKMVVIAEAFSSGHSVYRCYADYIRQIKEKYEVVLVAMESSVDDKGKELFDAARTFSLEENSLNDVVQLIAKEQPDVVFYPSIGLAAWTVALVSVRFAPIQIMAPGHPASSVSDAIDYMLSEESLVGDPACYTEKILLIEGGTETMMPPPGEKLPLPEPRKSPDVVRIAVNSISFKIGVPFLAACQMINQQCKRPIEWLFFTYEKEVGYYEASLNISQWLPNAQVVPRLMYNQYLHVLSLTDMAVGTFPFAGSNTNVDLTRLGIPKVYFLGNEIHSRADMIIYDHFELPDWLCCSDIESWCQSVIRLAEDDEARYQISQSLIQQKPQERLMVTEDKSINGFLNAVDWAWQHHDAIMDSGETIIRPQVAEAPLLVTESCD
ncbi:hypothetical protein [Pleionea sp. CnH1-48]|uniref:hypothetical protein n=1 Tax=Pleionea sp. CnH1-48 TaxID=2954494 RepID=UPI0020975478|nr:hypothetical protein [Pleionea sp. CnH1-48]MCO7226141.1 hypothetical protein [Pleionea sp. CnH1-48]